MSDFEDYHWKPLSWRSLGAAWGLTMTIIIGLVLILFSGCAVVYAPIAATAAVGEVALTVPPSALALLAP